MELPSSGVEWSDEDVVFADVFGSFESFAEFFHFFFGNDHADRIMAVHLHHDGVLAVPVHSAGAGFDDVPAGQQHAVPFLLQR